MLAHLPALRWAQDYGALDALLFWLPLAVALGVVALLVYGAVQQDLRQSANDPQIQLAENAAAALTAGAAPESVLPDDRVDLSSNLAPFLIVYDRSGTVSASSATLDGATPALPPGVLGGARSTSGSSAVWRQPGRLPLGPLQSLLGLQDEDRITWQPAPGVRIAAVIVAYGGPRPGFVLAGRSLRLVEQREDTLLRDVAGGLAGGLAITLAAAVGATAARRRLRNTWQSLNTD